MGGYSNRLYCSITTMPAQRRNGAYSAPAHSHSTSGLPRAVGIHRGVETETHHTKCLWHTTRRDSSGDRTFPTCRCPIYRKIHLITIFCRSAVVLPSKLVFVAGGDRNVWQYHGQIVTDRLQVAQRAHQTAARGAQVPQPSGPRMQ